MMRKEIGEPIKVTFVRPTASRLQRQTVELTMERRPLPDGRQLVRQYFQMQISELTDRVARRFDFQSAYPILIVTDVERGGVAEQTGLVPGDLILQINNATVRNVRELSLEMEKVNAGDIVEVKIMRIAVGIFGQVKRQYIARLKAQSIGPGRYSF
jgi:S1-C subfamily serine protease